MKKILIAIPVFLVLIVALLLVIPFLVDFEKFKPIVQSQVGNYVNGNLDYSSARLTILSGVGIELKDVKITSNTKTFGEEELFSVARVKI